MSRDFTINPAAAFAFAPAEAQAAEDNKILEELRAIGQSANDYAKANNFDPQTRAAYQHAVAVDAINQVRGQVTNAQALKDFYQIVMGYEDQASAGFLDGVSDVYNSLMSGLETGIGQAQSFIDPTWADDNRRASVEHRQRVSAAGQADRIRAENANAFRASIGDDPFNFVDQLKERPLDYIAEVGGNIAPSVAGVVGGTIASATGVGASVGVPMMAASVGIGAMQSGGAVRDDIYTTTMQMTNQELEQYSPMYQRLISEGMSPEAAKLEVATSVSENWDNIALATGLGAAASFIPAGGAGKNIVARALGQLAYAPERSAVNNALREAAVEAGTEAWQQRASNLAVRENVDNRREPNAGVAESAILGGAIGGGISLAGSAVHSRVNPEPARNSVDEAIEPTQTAEQQSNQAAEPVIPGATQYDRAALSEAARKLPEHDRKRFIEDFETDAKYGILDTESDTPYGRFVRDVLGLRNTVVPTETDAVAQVGETVPNNLQQPIHTRIGDDIDAANADTLYEQGDQAAVDQTQQDINNQGGKRVPKNISRRKQTNDKYYDVDDQQAAADSQAPRSSSLDRQRVRHIRGSKKFQAINDADYDTVNNVVLEPETAEQPVIEVASAKTEEVKPQEAVQVTFVDKSKVDALANANLKEFTPAELEARARKELNGNEYRLLVNILKQRTAEDYDADGNFIGQTSDLEGNNAKRERKPEKKATWVAKQFGRFATQQAEQATQTQTEAPSSMAAEPAVETQTEAQTEAQTTPVVETQTENQVPSTEPTQTQQVEPAPTQQSNTEVQNGESTVSQDLTSMNAKHTPVEHNMDFDTDYWKIRDHGFAVNENFAANLNENIDEVIETGIPDIFDGDARLTSEFESVKTQNADVFKQTVARRFPDNEELVVMATTAPIGVKKFSSEPAVVNPDGKLATTNNPPEFTTNVGRAALRASSIDGNVHGAYIRADNIYPWLGGNLTTDQRLALTRWAGEQGYDGVAFAGNGDVEFVPSKAGVSMGTQLTVSKSSGRLQKDHFYSRGNRQDSMSTEEVTNAISDLDIPEGVVNVVTSNDVSQAASDAHGYYDQESGTVTLIADNITSPNQARGVLWHELSHRILRTGRLVAERAKIITNAKTNKFLRDLAEKIQQSRQGRVDQAASDFDVAVEEAIVSVSSAFKTPNGLADLESEYGIKVPSSLRHGLRGTTSRLFQRFKSLISKAFNTKMSDADVYDFMNTKMSREQLLGDLNTKRSFGRAMDNAINTSLAHGVPDIPGFEKYLQEKPVNPDNPYDVPGIAYGEAEPVLRHAAQVLSNSDGNIKVYRAEHQGTHGKFGSSSAPSTDYGYFGVGTYFTLSKQQAMAYMNRGGERGMYEAETSIKNPYVWLGRALDDRADAEALTDWATTNGYDAILGSDSEIDYSQPGELPIEVVPLTSQVIHGNKIEGPGEAGLFYSRGSNNQDVLEFSKTGRSADPDNGLFGTGAKTWGELTKKIGRGIERRISDDLIPMKEYIEDLGLDNNTTQTLIGDLYLSDGAKANKSSEFEHDYMVPLFKKIHGIAKDNGMTYQDAKRTVGFWMSARYALIKNQDFIQQDRNAYQDASNEYNQNPTQTNYDKMMKARRQLAKRQADVYNPDPAADKFEAGVAGGYNNAKAQAVMANLERLVPKADIEAAAQHIYDMQAARLDLDLESGRIGQQAYNDYKANPYYVPLTGDPRADADVDDVINTGGQSVNQRGQKQAKGRTNSMAEDGIDATWRSVARSIGYFGYSKFKNGIRDVYMTKYNELLNQGMTELEASKEIEETMGIHREKVTMHRASDSVLMISENGDNYAYKLPKKAMDALMHNQRENTPWILRAAEIPTRLFARAVTQFYPAFAPINFARDAWERSTVLRTRTVYDQNGNKVNMDAVANRMLFKMSDPMAFRDTIFWTRPDGTTTRSQNLQDLMEAGGISTMGSFLARTEKDLIRRIQREGRWDKKTLDGVVHFTEAYNRAFDLVPPLAAYESLLEAGVSKRDAAAATLDTMNFRKTGLYMRPIKALYMFAQPTATGFVNLAKQLSTKKGAIMAATYYATMLGMYEVIRAVSGQDDNEAGNKVDQMGDVTRYIPIPNPADPGKYIKIPVGFGLPQLMWNMATNTSRAAHGDIEWSSAAANMASHWAKVVVPVSPADIPVDENPGAKLAMTATPSILQPFMSIVLDRTPFGAKLTPQYVDNGKLRSEQAKSTTAPEWKEFAVAIQRLTGVDAHAEQVKALWDGYSGMLGPLRDITKIAIENPNRARLGKEEYVPFVNSLYGPGNEYAIQQRYYEAFDKAKQLKNEYDSRKERGQLGSWLTPEKRRQINWFERADREGRKINQQKAKVTKNIKNGKPSEAQQKQINGFAKRTEQVQAKYLHEWRKMEGLNTKRGN